MKNANLRTSITLILKDGATELLREDLTILRLDDKANNEIEALADTLSDKISDDADRYNEEHEVFSKKLGDWKTQKKEFRRELLLEEDSESKEYTNRLDTWVNENTRPIKPKKAYSMNDAKNDLIDFRIRKEIVKGDTEAIADAMKRWGYDFIMGLIYEKVSEKKGN